MTGWQLASMSKSGTDVAYQYNADGLRTKKTVTQSGASTVYEYLWNESRLVGQKVGNDAVRILYDANDEPVGFTVNDSASYFYVKNLQGDVLAIVDKTGAEKVSYVYDAYGQIVSMTGDATLQKLNPCTYRGYYYDAETGLYYLQSRYYNPEWGRFINADKTEVLNITNNVKQANLYIYAENNPINYIDSSGDFGTPLQWAMAVIGGIAGWFFGDYVAKWFGYRSGWKYWTIRSGVAVGGAVIFWFAGTALLKVATRFLLSNSKVAARMPRYLLWFLGMGSSSGSIANQLYAKYAAHIFSKDHISKGILKLGSSRRDIFNKIFRVMSSKIAQARNGSNEIRAVIKGYKVTIRFYFKDGTIRSVDAFIGWGSRVLGKLLK